MKILDLYIIRKFISTFVFMVLLLIVVIVVIDVTERVEDFARTTATATEIIQHYYFNLIPYYANLLSPVCVFITVIYFTSQMAQNTEIVSMLSGGISLYRILRPYMACALVIAGVSFYLNAYIVPRATRERVDFEYKFLRKTHVMEERNIHKKVAPGTYVYMNSYNQLINEGYLFALDMVEDGKLKTKISSQKIIWQDSLKTWQLIGVTYRQFTDQGEYLYFKPTIDTSFILSPDDIYQKDGYAESLTLNELYTYIQLETDRGSDILEELIIEKYERFAYPLAAIILTLIGLPMSSRKSRGGIAMSIGLGLVFCFLYVILLLTSQAFIGDTFPAWLAIWLPNMLFFVLGVFLIRNAKQ